MADGSAPDRRRAHHAAEEPSPWEIEVYNDHIGGKSYRVLAAIHECSARHIGNIVNRVIDWKRPQLKEEMQTATRRLLDAHWNAFEQAMTAWEESRGQLVKETTTTQTGRVDRRGNPLGDEVKTERQYSSGDTRHLQTAIRALKEYRTILGHRPPSEDEGAGRVAGRSFDDVIGAELAKTERLLRDIKQRQTTGSDAPDDK